MVGGTHLRLGRLYYGDEKNPAQGLGGHGIALGFHGFFASGRAS